MRACIPDSSKEDGCELLSMHAEDETFLQRIITGDETWVHQYEPESKRRSMEWRHADSPRKKKFRLDVNC
ncbi:hypothetical protein EB796_002706 [Bugula neritina]|uniref:Uncharacterized protein n=1 Tax=Bugula neritina TaxID=10212 RepID=A0A7J7KLQ7_BUGNE|nr:hypothetical protein EB796_002706 [Bugula neritina]